MEFMNVIILISMAFAGVLAMPTPEEQVTSTSATVNIQNAVPADENCIESKMLKAAAEDDETDLPNRSMCKWKRKFNRDESRYPKILPEVQCIQELNQNNSDLKCEEIHYGIPVLRKVSGVWQWELEQLVVGCVWAKEYSTVVIDNINYYFIYLCFIQFVCVCF